MNEQLVLTLLSAVIGGFLGAIFSAFVPRLLYDPHLKIIGIDYHRSYQTYNLIVINEGRTAAINAAGRITIRPLSQASITEGREEIVETRHQISGDWRFSNEAWLRKEDWELGIEAEHVYWAIDPNPTKLNINPNVPERLTIAHSKGPWIDIASESFSKKRVRLTLKPEQAYYGAVVVVAENCRPSRPYLFKIALGQNGNAILEPYKGTLPER